MMAHWYVKDLSKLTKVSVQTLHYYDKVGLLRPSIRLDNGYRLYSEADLLKLQQIVALKFFGFSLVQIKTLLTGTVDMVELFSVQSQLLQKKATALIEASNALQSIISDCSGDRSVSWKTVIKSIEVYQMTQQLEKTWAGKVFTPEQLKEYASFEASLKTKRESEKKAFEQNWADLVAQIQENIKEDPKSSFGLNIAKHCMGMVNGLYGKEHAELKHTIWNDGFKKSKMDGDHFLAPEIVAWLDKAIDAYYQGRIYSILDQTAKPTPELLQQWNALMTEMYGNSKPLKDELITVAMTDEKVTQAARDWLEKL